MGRGIGGRGGGGGGQQVVQGTGQTASNSRALVPDSPSVALSFVITCTLRLSCACVCVCALESVTVRPYLRIGARVGVCVFVRYPERA